VFPYVMIGISFGILMSSMDRDGGFREAGSVATGSAGVQSCISI
jgi:hypothetical protein